MWARSGSGKSTWMLNLIQSLPAVPTLVVNMEMTARRQIEWLTAMAYPDLETPSNQIERVLRYGAAHPDYAELEQALQGLPDKFPHLYFANPSRPTVTELEQMIEDIGEQTGTPPVRVFIDHLGLLAGTEDGYQGYSNTAAGLHSLAMRKEVGIYCLQQTGRNTGEGRNDGHVPLTLSSGLYAGEADADWVFGMYRPDRNPKFNKKPYQFDSPEAYHKMLDERDTVKGKVILQVLKNRPFSEVNEEGIELLYNPHTKRYVEMN